MHSLGLMRNPLCRHMAGAHTWANIQRDFSGWHQGRSPYLIWAIDLDTLRVRQAVLRVRRRLPGLLRGDYVRQPHLTLELCGFPALSASASDEFMPEDVAVQVAGLRHAGLSPFGLDIGGVSSFDGAPYLVVRDRQQQLPVVRHALKGGGGDRLWGLFEPHVTVGLYARRYPVRRLAKQLRSRHDPALKVRVERLTLMAYDSARIGGKLRRLAVFELASGGLRWLSPWPGVGVL